VKAPKSVDFVEALPAAACGKVLKKELRRVLAGRGGARSERVEGESDMSVFAGKVVVITGGRLRHRPRVGATYYPRRVPRLALST